MALSYEGSQVFLTVTCGQFAGRLTHTLPNATPHPLSLQGAGVFEYCMAKGAGGVWGRVTPADAAADSFPVTNDDPIWWFTRLNWLYPSFNYIAGDANNAYTGSPARRTISNLQYADANGNNHWLDMAWNPVSAMRLPADRRPVGTQRQTRHLVTNAAQIVQNLSRDNVFSNASNAYGPAALFSTVFVVNSDDNSDAAPDNDTHDLDRREAIPNPQEADWSDPLNQPTFADRR